MGGSGVKGWELPRSVDGRCTILSGLRRKIRGGLGLWGSIKDGKMSEEKDAKREEKRREVKKRRLTVRRNERDVFESFNSTFLDPIEVGEPLRGSSGKIEVESTKSALCSTRLSYLSSLNLPPNSPSDNRLLRLPIVRILVLDRPHSQQPLSLSIFLQPLHHLLRSLSQHTLPFKPLPELRRELPIVVHGAEQRKVREEESMGEVVVQTVGGSTVDETGSGGCCDLGGGDDGEGGGGRGWGGKEEGVVGR